MRKRGSLFPESWNNINSVLQDLAKYPPDMPAIVLGDFNTWNRRL